MSMKAYPQDDNNTQGLIGRPGPEWSNSQKKIIAHLVFEF